MKRFLFILLFIATYFVGNATHQRAGEITYKYLSPLTYEVTIVTYSYAPSPADRFELEIKWGDGTSEILKRTNGPVNSNGFHIGEMVGPDIRKNLYVGTHTYPGAATYTISMEDPNRNMGVQNIPNSVEIPLYIETQLIINPFIGPNSSPILSMPPVDIGCVNNLFIHNPGAIDPDGDSLSYKLTICRGSSGNNILGYQYPNQVGSNVGGEFYIDAKTGDLVWDNPKMQGEYNVAFLIEEWRNGVKIGYTTRDMQINIIACSNNPPTLTYTSDTCVTANDTMSMVISAIDMDGDRVKIETSGEAFMLEPPATCTTVNEPGGCKAYIDWETSCQNVRLQPYTFYIRATDSSYVPLSSLGRLNVRVVAPKTENLTANASGNKIVLNWEHNTCENISGYKIYRRSGYYGFEPDNCETGVPAYTGYQLIETLGVTNSYEDGNVSNGIEYCYMVVATFADGSESYASDEVCSHLRKELPIITNVSIDETHNSGGIVDIAWSKPTEIDTNTYKGDFYYKIFRSRSDNPFSFTFVDSTLTIDDTIHKENNLNTKDYYYYYYVSLINSNGGAITDMGSSQTATSPFLRLSEGDKKAKVNLDIAVPWTNTGYVIYELNANNIFDSIATTYTLPYTIYNLMNETEYCFLVKTVGTYGTPGIIDPIINYSQLACVTPYDNEPPCTPELEITTNCDFFYNELFFEPDDISCRNDVYKSYILRSNNVYDTNLVVIDSTHAFVYQTANNNISGCYAIQFIDANGNKSEISDVVCVDSDVCGKYHLPNLFTPNGDEINDYLRPFPYTGVEKVDIVILNRWGQLVYKTNDPDIRWDGKILDTNIDASEGVYFYFGEVYEYTPEGVKPRKIQGSVTIRR